MNLKLETLADIMYVLVPHNSVLGNSFGVVLPKIGHVVPILGIISTYSGIGPVFSV